MALIDEIPGIFSELDSHSNCLQHNETLFNIYEGDLLSYVVNDLKQQLSQTQFDQIIFRLSPINILKRLNDKQSKIYSNPPLREIEPASPLNVDMFAYYHKTMQPDTNMQPANEFFNLFKNTWVEPYLHHGKPKLRSIPSDRFFVYSTDTVNPNEPTHLVKLMGKINYHGQELDIRYVYSKDEFLIVDKKGLILKDLMEAYGNANGINPYGTLPGVYINRSRHLLLPLPDTDSLAMTKLIPILLSDLNYAIMYQCFSIFYGVDVDSTNLKMGPNVFWEFKSDLTTGKTPQVGTIKPEVDITQVLAYINAQIALWFQSKGIKSGSIGTLTTENAASGIAKAIDESDTTEDRQIQTKYFKEAEELLWHKIINNFHPVWVSDPEFELKQLFAAGTEVCVSFPKQKPILSETEIITNIQTKIRMGLLTKQMALMELYPELTEGDIKDMLMKIDEERSIMIPDMTLDNGNNNKEVNEQVQ